MTFDVVIILIFFDEVIKFDFWRSVIRRSDPLSNVCVTQDFLVDLKGFATLERLGTWDLEYKLIFSCIIYIFILESFSLVFKIVRIQL